MTNPLVQISDLLDEVAEIFVSQAFSGHYAPPVLYLLRELEVRASKTDTYSMNDYEQSLGAIREAIDKRLRQGSWSQ